MTKFIIALLLFIPASYSLACSPPPENYFTFGGMQAVASSREVIQKMAVHKVESITKIANQANTFLVQAKGCSLSVKVESIRPNPDAPCGGPYEFFVDATTVPLCN